MADNGKGIFIPVQKEKHVPPKRPKGIVIGPPAAFAAPISGEGGV